MFGYTKDNIRLYVGLFLSLSQSYGIILFSIKTTIKQIIQLGQIIEHNME